jgi:hypothetical protein
MTKASEPKASDSATKTGALINLELNLDQIQTFLSRLNPGQLAKAITKINKMVAKEAKSAPAVNMVNMKKILGGLHATLALVEDYQAFRAPALRMMSVMLVSFLEAYLEDGLVEIALKNPKLIKTPVIEPNRLLEIDSIDQLRNEIRLNWAQGSLRPGGPVTWEKRLRDLGAPELQRTTLNKIQHLWDTRNLIVHSRSIATNAYAKTYKTLGFAAGHEVRVTHHLLGEWLDGLKEFLAWTEPFFLKYGSKPATPDVSPSTSCSC